MLQRITSRGFIKAGFVSKYGKVGNRSSESGSRVGSRHIQTHSIQSSLAKSIRTIVACKFYPSNNILSGYGLPMLQNCQLMGTTPDTAHDTKSLLELAPQQFIEYLQRKNIRRCFVVYDKEEGCPKASHPELEELAQFFQDDTIDYDEHEAVFMELGLRTQTLMGAFVWRTHRGQACGGIRLWQYRNMEQYLRDGVRLATGMGVKSALAGLWAGGGKGVVAEPGNKHLDPEFRQKMFLDYGDFLTSLNGCYVAAEDLGLTVQDLNYVHTRTRYTTCISEDLGGSGNPSFPTGIGVVAAMEGALDYLKHGSLAGKSVVIQGAGNVAVTVIEELLKRDIGSIHASDCHQKRIDDVKDMFGSAVSSGQLVLEKVDIDDVTVLARPCDILSPCALGNILNADTIPHIAAKIVCGAANNQLGSEQDNQLMEDNGITYVPDFLANRMGIVNCANETYGRLPDDPAIQRHFDRDWENSIYCLTKKILKRARKENVTPAVAAMEIADKMSLELHPLWPHRSQKIIKSLVNTGWHEGRNFW